MLLFNHQKRTIFTDVLPRISGFTHHFGGDPSDYGFRVPVLAPPCQIICVLDTADEMVPISLPGVRHVPLLFWSFEDFIYRLVNEREIEIVTNPDNATLGDEGTLYSQDRRFPRAEGL